MKITELLESQSYALLLEEVAGDRPDIQAAAVEIHESVVEYLETTMLAEQGNVKSAILKVDQINQLFQNAAKINKGTAVGGELDSLAKKGSSVAAAGKKIVKVILKAKKQLQNGDPVQNFQTKVEQIKAKFVEKQPKVEKKLDAVIAYGEKHPKKSSFIIAALAGLTGFLGTPAAGAVIGLGLMSIINAAKNESDVDNKSSKDEQQAVADAINNATNA